MSKKVKLIQTDPGLSTGGIILLILAVVVVFGAGAYFFFFHGDSMSLPNEQEIIAAQKAQMQQPK